MTLSGLELLNCASLYLFNKHAIELDEYEDYLLDEYTTIDQGKQTKTINIIVLRS